MVDRITPATGDREREVLALELGVEDASPVFCEGFRRWVLEDVFPAGRPPLEEVGVQFVPDVTPYEMMKIRILNGGHAAIAYPAGLMDIHFVHEAMEEPLVLGFLRKLEREEIIPVVPPVPGTDLAAYYRIVETRFANPKIGDTVRRLCLDGSNRQPKFIVPSIAANLEKGRGISGLALESALWCRYCFGTSDNGKAIEPNDPNWDRLQASARRAKEDPAAWLAMKDIYGEVGNSEGFASAFAAALTALWKDGTRATLQRYLDGP
jgi:mannitol 2-dehydrogenase